MSDDVSSANDSAERQHGEGQYQMLWDCKFCGTEKLLGITHRHCPNCGSAQDPTRRYFPAESDMVLLKDHQYVGVDVICPACNQPNSVASKFCSECGADLATGQPAPLQAEVVLGTGGLAAATQHDVVAESFQAEMARVGAEEQASNKGGGLFSRRTLLIILGVLLLAVCVFGVYYALTYREKAAGSVTGMVWERVIRIEKYGPISMNAWDDQVPSGAYNERCVERQRGTRQVQTGSHQECSNVDQGDGSFARQCRDVADYSSEPVYDDWCTFTVNTWTFSRNVKAAGEGTSPAPEWPDVQLAAGLGAMGQERIASQGEKYAVQFKENDGKTHTCTYSSQTAWAQFSVGDGVTFESGLTGGIDCATLKVGKVRPTRR